MKKEMEINVVGGEDTVKQVLREVVLEGLAGIVASIQEAEDVLKITTDINFTVDVGEGRVMRLRLDKAVKANEIQ